MIRIRPSLLRRSWIVGVCVILAGLTAIAVAAARDSTYYQAQAILEVPVNGGAGDTTETAPAMVATLYLDVILTDQSISRRIASRTGLSVVAARSRLTATRDAGTSVIRVTFRGPTAVDATAGRDALVSAVVGTARSTSSIPAGGLALLDGTGAARRVSRDVPGGPAPIGIILGLIIGVAALIAWDRWDPRVDSAEVLHDEFAVPVTTLSARTPDPALEAIALRWGDLLKPTSRPTVALVPGSAAAREATVRLATRLRGVLALNGTDVVIADAPGGTSGAELSAVRAGLVVLVEHAGEPLRVDRRVVADLAQLGAAPSWAILVSGE